MLNFSTLSQGMEEYDPEKWPASTDLGNVSHVVPTFQPGYAIPCKGINHTKEFAEASGAPEAQGPTLLVSKAMAMTALTIFRTPQTLEEVRRVFEEDIADDS
ncbi:Peptidase M20 domain-containing protein 2 [Argiope bruennichi]|uniref:Peptidase M20 domain-containing protein 2 n=1 Tax=Argiope bruennichi TaxID=94029 RepID=A0A8T0DZM6_ARGBR|nr:Peptidase M20 domain-containing protein 2 [Argiope bruennichi]